MGIPYSRFRFLIGSLLAGAVIVPFSWLVLNPLARAGPSVQLGSTPTTAYFAPLVTKAAVDSFTLIDWDLGAGAITLDQASDYKVYALFGSSLLPSKYQSDVPIPMEGTDSLIFAIKDWNQLNAQTFTSFELN